MNTPSITVLIAGGILSILVGMYIFNTSAELEYMSGEEIQYFFTCKEYLPTGPGVQPFDPHYCIRSYFEAPELMLGTIVSLGFIATGVTMVAIALLRRKKSTKTKANLSH